MQKGNHARRNREDGIAGPDEEGCEWWTNASEREASEVRTRLPSFIPTLKVPLTSGSSFPPPPIIAHQVDEIFAWFFIGTR